MDAKSVSPDWYVNKRQWESDDRYSIKWRTFGQISLVMIGLVLCFLFVIAQWSDQRFEANRHQTHLQYQLQLERLIESSAEKMVQLSRAVSLNAGLMEAVHQGDTSKINSELEALDWNLQTDSGISLLGLYNLELENLFTYGEQGRKEFIARVIQNEQSHWLVDCNRACRIVTYTALLHRGEMSGVLVLVEPISNVMLRFHRVANIDTGLLADVNQREGGLIPTWQRSLVALTNPEESKQVLNQASQNYSLEELRKGVGLVSMGDALYELKAMPIEDSQVVVISDVSERYLELSRSKGQTIQMTALALVLGELFLLMFLWHPLRKIKMSEQLEGFVVKQAELLREKSLALTRAQSLSENLCDSVSAAIIMLDHKGQVTLANNYFVKLLGLTHKEITSHHIGEFVRDDNPSFKQRISDLSSGVIDEYENLGRLITSSNDSHKMIWRYVPSYFCGDDLDEEHDRSVIAIGMPLMLPTRENEQEWLNAHDAATGMLNRKGAYALLQSRLNRLALEREMASDRYALVLLRFDDVTPKNPHHEQAYTKLLSVFSARLNEQTVFSEVDVVRLDFNEIAVCCHISHGNQLGSLRVFVGDSIDAASRVMGIEIGRLKISCIELNSGDCTPYSAIQRAQDLYRE